MINKWLVQKEYNIKHDWMGKVILWELCKKLKFGPTNKWYMHNSASALENETLKLLWDFQIQTDHLISARRPDLVELFWLTIGKIERNEKKDNYVDLAGDLKKKLWNLNLMFIHIVIGALGTVTKELLKADEWLGNKSTGRDHPNYYIIETSQISENSPGDLLSLKRHWKTIS